MPRSVNPELKSRIDSLATDGGRALSAGELADVIGEVARSLVADLGPLRSVAPDAGGGVEQPAASVETTPACDLELALAAVAKIGTIDQGESPLASIAHDLEEIRSATQEAAANILSCAESIDNIGEHLDLEPDDQAMLANLSTKIFEASTFQDLTGQRLTRIADGLRQIEYYVATTKAALGDKTAASAAAELSHTLEETEHRKMEYYLHGSEDAGTANTQEEIDKILASFD